MAFMGVMIIGILMTMAFIGVCSLGISLILYIICKIIGKSKKLKIGYIIFLIIGILGIAPLIVISTIGRITSLLIAIFS